MLTETTRKGIEEFVSFKFMLTFNCREREERKMACPAFKKLPSPCAQGLA